MEDDFKAAFEGIMDRIGKEPPEGTKGKVDYERFFNANQRAKGAVAGLEALEKLHDKFVTDTATAHQAEIKGLNETTAKTVGGLQAKHSEDLIFAGTGVDELGRSVIRTAYQAEPEATRPKSAALWYQVQLGAVKAHKEDPDKNEAPKLHPSIAAIMTPAAKEGKKEEKRRAPGPGRRPASGDLVANARGKGRKAMEEAIRKDRGY